MNEFLYVVVIYNKGIEQSETLQSLINNMHIIHNSDVIIWDNSPIKQIDDEELVCFTNKNIGIQYIHDDKNSSLSVIFNFMINNKVLDYKHFVLLDHDTNVTSRYIEQVYSCTESNPSTMLFLPRVYCNGNMVSPGHLYFFIGRYIKQKLVGQQVARFKTAINSGMIIDTKYFVKYHYKYDEALRFYGTDDHFMKKFAKTSELFYVMDCDIQHNLNFFDKSESKSQKAQRFTEIMSAILYQNKEHALLFIASRIYVSAKVIQMCIINRSMKFWFPLWKI